VSTDRAIDDHSVAAIVAEPGDRRQVPVARRFGAALPPICAAAALELDQCGISRPMV